MPVCKTDTLNADLQLERGKMKNGEVVQDAVVVEENDVKVNTTPPVVDGQQNQQPTVHVLVERDPETGNIDVDVIATGDVRATEVESLLKLGLNKWRGKINLPG